ncbi:ORF126 [White spot syndrome virus]|uniref:ORF126 n=1 Tax=White spot syndrome virus TaxID=342409 RepID=A0A2D3I6B4_9VIRU|nr:ORF126 [White spot syndrome virus]
MCTNSTHLLIWYTLKRCLFCDIIKIDVFINETYYLYQKIYYDVFHWDGFSLTNLAYVCVHASPSFTLHLHLKNF